MVENTNPVVDELELEETTIIRTGSKDVVMVYGAGDVDLVEVLELRPDFATVRLPNGSTYRTVVEDLGIGVDDSIVAEYDPEPFAGEPYARGTIVVVDGEVGKIVAVGQEPTTRTPNGFYSVAIGATTRTVQHSFMSRREGFGSATIPCGWCDRDVAVAADLGQVAYCSTDCERADGYVDPERLDFPATDSRPVLELELARQAESDALVESFVADGDRDPDSVAAKVAAELAERHVCTKLDRTGTCVSCGRRVLSSFRGFPLPTPELDRGTGPNRYPPVLRDQAGRIVDVG